MFNKIAFGVLALGITAAAWTAEGSGCCCKEKEMECCKGANCSMMETRQETTTPVLREEYSEPVYLNSSEGRGTTKPAAEARFRK
jgi:hypothetical protein